MTSNTVFGAAFSTELEVVQGRSGCICCHEHSSLRIVVAELLIKNQLLRFKLSQSQAIVSQLGLALDQVQLRPVSAAELHSTLNILNALLKPESEC